MIALFRIFFARSASKVSAHAPQQLENLIEKDKEEETKAKGVLGPTRRLYILHRSVESVSS